MRVPATEQFHARPLNANFGVEIVGVDIAKAEPAVCQAVVDLLRRHAAIVLRDQQLSPEDQIAFTRLFGEPAENRTRIEYTVPGFPEIFVISNKVVNGKKIGDHRVGSKWHTDGSWKERPADVTILHALEVPKEGSDTLIADLCAAWNALPAEKQAQLDGRMIHISFAHLARQADHNLTEEQLKTSPDVWHPLVRRHPVDGRRTLYLGTTAVRGVSGMPSEQGIELVEELVAFATQEQFLYRHKWKVGDVLVWDNACTLHRGTPFDTENDVRLVHRTWVRGSKPC
jgi:taurine dioxygenase